MTDLPAWVDKATLMHNICASERTVDAWVKQGILPPARLRGGKLMWKWKEVDEWLTNGGPETSEAERITHATRALASH